MDDGVVTNASYTVAHAIEDWLADGLAGRAPKTVSTQREVLEPLIDIIGAVPLRELSAANVRSALNDLAATRATPTVGMTHAGLARAIRHAEANDKVRRNVATLVDTRRPGRPPVEVADIRAGRCPDPGGTVVRPVRLRCLESPGRRPDRRGACTAVASVWRRVICSVRWRNAVSAARVLARRVTPCRPTLLGPCVSVMGRFLGLSADNAGMGQR
jgi:hypothetical protein